MGHVCVVKIKNGTNMMFANPAIIHALNKKDCPTKDVSEKELRELLKQQQNETSVDLVYICKTMKSRVLINDVLYGIKE
jgi:hypothetical protein